MFKVNGRDVRNRKEYIIKLFISIVLGFAPVYTFFVPYIRYSFGKYVYDVSAFHLLIADSFNIGGELIKVPELAKFTVIFGVLSSILGVLFVIYKKSICSGISFVFSALAPLILLFTGSEIQSSASNIKILEVKIAYLLPFSLVIIFCLFAAIFAVWTIGTEKLAEAIFLIFASVSVGSVFIITIYMVAAGAPAIYNIGIFKFIFGAHWQPSKGIYGILPLILSSVAATFGAIIIGVPIGVLAAAFLSETASTKLSNIIRPAVQLMAGIPSVVYGFFGMLIIVPFIKKLFPLSTIGESLLAVIIILTIMILPTIINISENSLRAVSNTYKEASLALGTTPVETIFRVTIPAAKSGILSGVILGVGRAIGETMAVIMVAGNVVNMPSLLGTVRLLTTGIVLEMSYSTGLHRQALFAIGLVLFVFIMIVNISFTAISKKGVQINER